MPRRNIDEMLRMIEDPSGYHRVQYEPLDPGRWKDTRYNTSSSDYALHVSQDESAARLCALKLSQSFRKPNYV